MSTFVYRIHVCSLWRNATDWQRLGVNQSTQCPKDNPIFKSFLLSQISFIPRPDRWLYSSSLSKLRPTLTLTCDIFLHHVATNYSLCFLQATANKWVDRFLTGKKQQWPFWLDVSQGNIVISHVIFLLLFILRPFSCVFKRNAVITKTSCQNMVLHHFICYFVKTFPD